ncbi:MAG: zinc ribbon domain-containing protein [Oscillospiraceae bacterium]|nr:zinc ribbon domain-containing protein [Oscillospiraceae bacterium]
MDLESIMDGGTPEEQKPAVEYTAQVASPLVSGEAKLKIGEKALTAAALFDTAEIAFSEITAIALADYAVTVNTDGGDYIFSRMGSLCQPFYDALLDAYNKAVLRSLFIKGSPVLTAKGDYSYTENGADIKGSAAVRVYENNVTALPPDLSARRVPLCFVTAMGKGGFSLTLTLDTGEAYTYSKLGYETDIFAEAVERQIRKLRENALAAVKEIDPGLTAAQASQIAKIMPQGAAAPIGKLADIAPSFAAALENKIAETRAAEYYGAFKELCYPAQIWVGFRKNEAAMETSGLSGTPAGGLGEILGKLTDAIAAGDGDEAPDPYLLWLIAPSPDGQFAAVEFAEADSATFLYKTGGDFTAFARQLNRALEAINFKREAIRLSDDDLRKPENADYFMAAKRTAALRFVRANFAGRIIHSSAESWRRKLAQTWNGEAEPVPAQTGAKFCGQCGAAVTQGVKFCGGCGNKL